jgi:probable HAF family extracellular repeat protein
MNRFHLRCSPGLAFTCPFLLATTVHAASYALTDLGTLGDPYNYSSGIGINSGGRVVGDSYYVTDPAPLLIASQLFSHAFLYDGAIHDLGTLGGAESSASMINTNGLIVGNSDTESSGPHAFLYDSAMHDLGTLGGSTSYATAVNSESQIAGFADTAAGFPHAFLYDTSMHDLGTLGGNKSYGKAMNDSGHIVGKSEISFGISVSHAFLYDGTMHDLGTLGGTGSSAESIAASGHVVGVSNTAHDATFHGFLYDGTMHDIGDLGGGYSDATAINTSDEITGGSGKSNGDYHAFLYTVHGGMRDLNSLIDQFSGWDLQTGWAINDAGQITGYGILNGKARAFLLTPVPEPSAIVLMLLSLLGLLPKRRRMPHC